jgi:hypothetical protein
MYIQTYGNLLGRRISDNAVIATGFKPPYAGYPTTRTLSQALRPFPQYGGINTNGGAMNEGHSTYNSFEASFEYRLSRGLFLSSAYTFSKLIASAYYERGQSVGTMNHYNRRLDKAVGQADRPQVFTLAYIYELPFGRQKYFLRSSSRPVNALVGGWSISGFHRYTSGPALAITSNQELYGAGRARGSFAPGAGDTIPLLNPKWSPDPKVAWSVPYLNPAAFFRPNTGEYGNTPALISQLRGRGVVSEDIVLLKRIFLGERRHLELRASAFNALNRHRLPDPNTAVNSAQFGMITSPQGNAPREIQLGARLVF